jgi:KamA family protein
MAEKRLSYFGIPQIEKLQQIGGLSDEQCHAIRVVAQVLPFRVSNYVLEELIDWNNIPADPMFQLTVMQKDMLTPSQFAQIESAMGSELDLKNAVRNVRMELNPHPSGQLSHNVPKINDEPVAGLQHKYRETAIMFPASGQSCFSYCTFCFRWPQFVGDSDLKFATDRHNKHLDYLREHKEITDILITGGDPMTMRAKHLEMFIKPLLEPEFDHIQTIRIGTKVLSFWPNRFTTDKDADNYLRIFEEVAEKKHLAFMAHINHGQELTTDSVQEAIKRIRSTGAIIRSQAPILRNINDDPKIWADNWNKQVNMGIIPYYMFVERDTGPKKYFEVPLARCHDIYQQAFQTVSGLARTVRGPSMSAFPGKVCVEGKALVGGKQAFVLSFLQGRNADWVKQPFFAKFDETACWLNDLEPLEGGEWFFDK